mgnify:CR=1 FL=1
MDSGGAMGNSPYGNAWRAYARELPSTAWLPTPLWGVVESESHTEATILSKFRHEVFRFAMGAHQRFHGIYLYDERTRRLKCALDGDGALVLTFGDAALKARYAETDDECTVGAAVPPKGRLFATAWERTVDNESTCTMRWTKRLARA